MPLDLQPLNPEVSTIPILSREEKKQQLPHEVAISKEKSEHEDRNIVFSFSQYNHTQCEIADLQKTDAKKLTVQLEKTSKIFAKNLLYSTAAGVQCKPVHNGGEYSCLFNSLPQDANLLEINYTSTGRIFGYLVENIFNIVVIKRKHLK